MSELMYSEIIFFIIGIAIGANALLGVNFIYTSGAKSVCEASMADEYTCEWQMVAINYNLRKDITNE